MSLKKLIQHLTTTKRRRKSPALLQEPRASPKPFPAGVLKMFCARAIFLLRLSPCKDCPSIPRYDYDYAFLADDGRARLEPSTESCVPPALLDPSCCCCCCCTSPLHTVDGKWPWWYASNGVVGTPGCITIFAFASCSPRDEEKTEVVNEGGELFDTKDSGPEEEEEEVIAVNEGGSCW